MEILKSDLLEFRRNLSLLNQILNLAFSAFFVFFLPPLMFARRTALVMPRALRMPSAECRLDDSPAFRANLVWRLLGQLLDLLFSILECLWTAPLRAGRL